MGAVGSVLDAPGGGSASGNAGKSVLSPGIGSHVYFDGTPVTVSASGAGNWVFDHWEDALTGTDSSQTLVMNANKSVTGVFLPLHTLTTSIEGQGTGSVSPSSGEYRQGEVLWLTASPGSKSWFVQWHNDLSGSDNPGRLVMSGQKHVSAEFDTNVLTVQKVGQGEVSPSGGSYGQDEEVNITATPKEGWVFDHWEIDLSGTDSSTSLLMNEDKTVRAVFKELFTLTMAKVPGSATGSVDPSPGEHLYKDGDEATLSATDGATWLFVNWSGDLGGNTTPVTVTMDEDKTVTGNFVTLDRIQHNNGTEYVDVPDPLYVLKGDTMTFKAIPNPEGATWPQGKPAWAGTSGATGSGETKSVTFNTASSSSSDYKTVTAECGATVTANVVVVEAILQSVTFGGWEKYAMTKVSADQWDPGDGLYHPGAQDVTVPDKAWTADPPFSDPVCYDVGAAGNNFTTTVELATVPAIPSGIPIQLQGKREGDTLFSAQDSLGPGVVAIGPMPSTKSIRNDIGQESLIICWFVSAGGRPAISLGSSSNLLLCTYGNPGNDNISAKVIYWLTSHGSNLKDIAAAYADTVNTRTNFGLPTVPSYWAILDDPPKQYQVECAEGRNAVLEYLKTLGVPFTMRGPSCAYASGDVDVTDQEIISDDSLYFTMNFNAAFACDWSPAENVYTILDESATRWYQSVWPLGNQVCGLGSDPVVKDTHARFLVLDYVRDNSSDFRQYHGQLSGPYQLVNPHDSKSLPLQWQP